MALCFIQAYYLFISKSKLNIQCLTNTSQLTQVVSLQWYDGKHGLPQPESPTLVICYDNGRLQMMVNESDESEYGFQESVCQCQLREYHA